MKCGVGDYTAILAERLSALPGMEIGVLTGSKAADRAGVHLIRPTSDWGWGDLHQILTGVKKFHPDLVHIQYPTLGYGVSKLPVMLPCFIRRMGYPVVQTWHEVIRGARCLRYLPAALCNNAVTVIEENYESLTQAWFWRLAKRSRLVRIPIGSNIPPSGLSDEARIQLRSELICGQERLIAFFGFVHPAKGAEQLFAVADPNRDHLLLICELNQHDPEHAAMLQLASQPAWRGRVTITGYQDAKNAARLLAASDAALFPFVEGVTPRNASVMAAAMQGTFVVTTSTSRKGYDERQHIWYVAPGDVASINEALNRYSGRRSCTPSTAGGDWEEVVAAHVKLYQAVLNRS